MELAGTYKCTLETPLGKKEGTLVVVPSADGNHFTGGLSNPMLGSLEIEGGMIEDDMLICQLQVTSPRRMTVECEVIVDGNRLNGFVTAGIFGEMKLTGQRVS